jgi:hypothetical protein
MKDFEQITTARRKGNGYNDNTGEVQGNLQNSHWQCC